MFSRWLVRGIVWSVALFADAAVAAGPPKRVAVVPVEAADEALSEQLTGLVWDAVARRDDVEAHDLVTTRAELADAASMGLSCATDDTTCLTKLAILLRVDQLVLARVREGSLSLSLLDAAAATTLNHVDGALPDGGPDRVRAVRELVDGLFSPFGEDVDASSPPPEPSSAEPPAPASSTVEEPASDALFVTGAILAGAGAGVAALAGGGAGVIDGALLFSDVGASKQEREDLLLAERVLAGVAVAGVAVAAVGGVLVALAWGSE